MWRWPAAQPPALSTVAARTPIRSASYKASVEIRSRAPPRRSETTGSVAAHRRGAFPALALGLWRFGKHIAARIAKVIPVAP
jgi:hypothetical protein